MVYVSNSGVIVNQNLNLNKFYIYIYIYIYNECSYSPEVLLPLSPDDAVDALQQERYHQAQQQPVLLVVKILCDTPHRQDGVEGKGSAHHKRLDDVETALANHTAWVWTRIPQRCSGFFYCCYWQCPPAAYVFFVVVVFPLGLTMYVRRLLILVL